MSCSVHVPCSNVLELEAAMSTVCLQHFFENLQHFGAQTVRVKCQFATKAGVGFVLGFV